MSLSSDVNKLLVAILKGYCKETSNFLCLVIMWTGFALSCVVEFRILLVLGTV